MAVHLQVSHLPDIFVLMCHTDLTSSNVLLQLANFDSWSEQEVYAQLGLPQMERVETVEVLPPGLSALRYVVDSAVFSNLTHRLVTGNICIIDFGESFLIYNPPTDGLGIPEAYKAPEV